MAISLERIKKYRRWFGWIFGTSFAVLLILWIVTLDYQPQMGNSPPAKETPFPWFDASMLVIIGSLLTSTTTLIGFLVTTLISWRKEGRENDHAVLELEKKKLELEKLRGEISNKNAAAQDKRKKMTKRKRVV